MWEEQNTATCQTLGHDLGGIIKGKAHFPDSLSNTSLGFSDPAKVYCMDDSFSTTNDPLKGDEDIDT